MNGQKLVVIGQGSDFHSLDVHTHLPAAVARGTLSTRRINEDMPHGLGGSGKEMSPSGESPWLVPGQAQPRLVNQGRGLESVTRSLPSHFVRGQFAQFLVNQRKQFLRGRLIAARHGFENTSDVVDEKYNTISSWKTPELRVRTRRARLVRPVSDWQVKTTRRF